MTAATTPRSFTNAFNIIQEIISLGWVEIPPNFKGAGAPGNTLEYLVDVEENNRDSPDLEDWELKFHGGTSSLLTLFHKDPEPRGILNAVVDFFGWDDGKGRISFRHTISGRSERGFRVVNENDRISIINETNPAIIPYWNHNTILGQMAGKLRRLIVVNGKLNKRERMVRYNNAIAYWDVDLIGFCRAIENGLVYVDFDARTSRGRGTALRNHGTKFRIKIANIGLLYQNKQEIKP